MGGTKNTRIQGEQEGFHHRWGELRIPGYKIRREGYHHRRGGLRIPGYKVSRGDIIIDGGNSEYQDTR